jgi:hypothetical protein
MTVEIQKGDIGEVVGYEYSLDELRRSRVPQVTNLYIKEERK